MSCVILKICGLILSELGKHRCHGIRMMYAQGHLMEGSYGDPSREAAAAEMAMDAGVLHGMC